MFLIFEICVNSLYAFSALFVGFKTSFNSINTMMNSLKILNYGPKALSKTDKCHFGYGFYKKKMKLNNLHHLLFKVL